MKRKTMVTISMVSAFVYLACLESGNNTSKDASRKISDASRPVEQKNPLPFLYYYRKDFEKIFKNQEKGCEQVLNDMFRFITRHKVPFAKIADTQSNQNPPPSEFSKKHVTLWMEFAEKCPEQTARINQILYSVLKPL